MKAIRINFGLSLMILSVFSLSLLQFCSDKDDGRTIDPDENTGGTIETFTDTRDGQIYDIAEIGNQTWFIENLNYQKTDSWLYDNSSSNGSTYGRLYTWDAANSACPSGWHLPTDEEWKELEMHLGMSQSEADDFGNRGTDEGKKLKSTSGWLNNGNGTNSSGFNALPGGLRATTGGYAYLGSAGYWWTATDPYGLPLNRSLGDDSDRIQRNPAGSELGSSVRCVKN